MLNHLSTKLFHLLNNRGITEHQIQLEYSSLQLKNSLPPEENSNKPLVLQGSELLLTAEKLSNDPTFSLDFGKSIKITDLSTLGFAIMCCLNVKDVIQLLVKYSPLLSNEVQWQFFECDEYSALRINHSSNNPDMVRVDIESSYASINEIGKFVLGHPLFDARLELNYDKPSHGDLYSNFFSIPTFFEQKHNQLILGEKILNTPLCTTNKHKKIIFEQQCRLLLQDINDNSTFSSKVRLSIAYNFGETGVFTNIKQVADRLFTSERTLRRRLSDENTNFRQLSYEVRNALAQNFLTSTAMTASEISQLLAYTEASNFRRAFLRLNKLTPSQYRTKFKETC